MITNNYCNRSIIIYEAILLNIMCLLHWLFFLKENQDIEWAFSRTQMWLKYLDNRGTALPPPLNILGLLCALFTTCCKVIVVVVVVVVLCMVVDKDSQIRRRGGKTYNVSTTPYRVCWLTFRALTLRFSFALTKGYRSKRQPTHSLRRSAYPHQPYVDTLYII